jgi:hypothetical protein
MMKYILLIISFLIVTSGFSQRFHDKDYGVILAVTYQPSWYKLYNKNDWNNVDERANSNFDYISEPNNPKGFNAHSVGLSVGIPLTAEFVIQTEFLYSTQTQYHRKNPFNTNPADPNSKVYYQVKIENNLQMLRIPLMLKYRYELGESDVYLSGLIGVQFSYTLDYHAQETAYRTKIIVNNTSGSTRFVNYEDSLEIYTSRKSDRTYQKIWNSKGEYQGETDYNNLQQFSEINWGTVAGLEFSALVANSLFIGVGGRFEYDFTDAGTNDSSDSVFPSQTPGNPRVPSHHMRYGFTVSAGYVF